MTAPGTPLYVFMHLEKTGGTTINTHLAEHLGFDEEFAHMGPWGNQARAVAGQPRPDEWPADRRNRLRVISGHQAHATIHRLVEGREARYFTFIRNPAALAVSQYNHDASRLPTPPGFWDWYETRDPNPQRAGLDHRLGCAGLDEVLERLADFWFVGVTEQLDRDLPHILQAIGVPGQFTNRRVAGGGNDLAGPWPAIEDVVITRHQDVTDEIRNRITADDSDDVRLHEWATTRSRELGERYGWY